MARVNQDMLARANKHAAVLRKREEQFSRCVCASMCSIGIVVWCCGAIPPFLSVFVAAIFGSHVCPSNLGPWSQGGGVNSNTPCQISY